MIHSPTDPIWEMFKEVRRSNPNEIIDTKTKQIESCLLAGGICFNQSLQALELSKVTTMFAAWDPPIEAEWAVTLEQFMDFKFKRTSGASASTTMASPGDSVVSVSAPNSVAMAPHFVSPGRPVILLGTLLLSEDRIGEIVEVFCKEQFVEIFECNPQLFDGEVLKPKMDEKVTDILIRLACVKWGNLNWDKVFCNKVAGILRDHGLKLPKRGKTPSYKRDWAIIARDKASSFRNKLENGLYKNVMVLCEEDVTDELQRLVEKGLKITIDKSRVSLFAPEVRAMDDLTHLPHMRLRHCESCELARLSSTLHSTLSMLLTAHVLDASCQGTEGQERAAEGPGGAVHGGKE